MEPVQAYQSHNGKLWATKHEAREEDFRERCIALENAVLELSRDTGKWIGGQQRRVQNRLAGGYWESLTEQIAKILRLVSETIPEVAYFRAYYQQQEEEAKEEIPF